LKHSASLSVFAMLATILVGSPAAAATPPTGSGAPFSVVMPGELSTEQCPVGYQGANGLIVDVSTGLRWTECWSAKAWQAYVLGGDVWERFKASGGTYDPTADRIAMEEFRAMVERARQAAYEESLAWNQANPGRQKCVSYGPFTDPNGGQTSGGVCANPVSAPVAPSGSPSVAAEPVAAAPVGESDISSGGSPSSSSETASASPSSSPTLSSSLPMDPVPSGGVSYKGSGFPFTVILEGQNSNSSCPAGFQAANGLIADVGLGKTFTECWPERAWTAYRLGGEAWELFKATGGTYDPSVEIDRRNKVALLKARAKQIADVAALQTPGIERCSSWSGFGESGRECSYAFVAPGSSSPVVSPSTSTSSTVSPIVQTTSSAPVAISQPGSSESASTQSEVASSSPSVELQSVQIAGSSATVARKALLITPDAEEASSISALANSITAVRSVQRTTLQALPRDSTLTYSVVSLTPSICQASTFRVRINRPGLCQLEIQITDSAGNEYEITKRVRRM
jgi:hypothetical protein